MEGTTSTADNGDFGTAPSEICGYCGVALEGDRCKVVLKSDKQSNAKISGCSCPCFDSHHNYKSPLSSSTKTPCTNVPVLCQEDPCKGLSTVFFRYNIASHFRSAHDNLDVTEIISTAMAKLTTAGPTVDISGELSLFDQERHTQAHEVVLAIHKERSSVVAKFKSQKVRSSATVALPTTTGARAAAAAAEGDPIFSASNLYAGSGFFAAATLMSQGEVEGGVDTPMEGGGLMEKPRLRGRRGGRRRMDEIRGERGLGGGAPCCGSRQSVCWTARACARGQRVARGLWVWLIYSC